ncbi:MAG: peptidase in kexin sedolisin [Hydrocarboniphaga sp.]|uniref:S8 family peptidase n=1 Tax=Hydrocarboniphaga sp. TaxID=2033016 RepID=UPI00262C27A5|nr:S8 family peptidase [Hydrocarboniphaga sp.]MDB5968230.1 peptidase in kexin sedolisin [Hydrocarboniphaga sp.]
MKSKLQSKLLLVTLLAAAASTISLSAAAAGRPELVKASLDAQRPYITGELLIQFKAGTAAADKAAALKPVGGNVLQSLVKGGRGQLDLDRVSFGGNVSIETAMRLLQASPRVDFAEPNWVYQHDTVSNDPYYLDGSLYGMYGSSTSPSNIYGSGAGEAWAVEHICSNKMIVGVIDEGAMYTHEDLKANFWTNPFDAVDGIDNDGNGYIDDVHGWDFDGNDNSTFDGSGDDHGTHVSGTIAAVGGNGIGVAGVCWKAKIISAKFLGARGGTTANAILAIDYLSDLKTRHALKMPAINNSWGGGGFSQALKDAIDRSGVAEILFIAAAGNDGVDDDVSPHYPSSYDSETIVSVASIDSSGALSSFSNYGAVSVDIGAPGSSIVSTVPSKAINPSKVKSAYASYSGTSMATPHVTGAVVMLSSIKSGKTALQLKDLLISKGTPTASLDGKTSSGKRLNLGD